MSQITRSPILPPNVASPAEDRAAALVASQQRGEAMFRAVGDAFRSETVIPWLLRQAGRAGYTYDPKFTLSDDETFKQLTEGLPEDMWDAFDDAVSMDHATRIRDQMLEVAESRQRLASLGWGGVGARVAAAVLDPVGIAAGVATGGLGYAVKGGRVARMLRTGVIVGGTEAALEGYLTTQDPEREAADVIWAGAGGLVLGGAADLLADGAISRAARRLRKDVEYGEVEAAMGAAARGELSGSSRESLIQMSDEGRAYFREQITAQEQGRVIDDLIQRSGFDPVDDADIIAEIRALPPEEALNRFTIPKGQGVSVDTPVSYVPERAATNRENPPDAPPPFEPDLKAGDFDPTPIGADRPAFANVRFGFSALLGKVKGEAGVRAGNMYVTDALAKKGGRVSHEGADTWKARKVRGVEAEYHRVAEPAFRQWARENGVSPTFKMSAREDFFNEVGKAMRLPPGVYTRDKHVNAAADAQRRLQKKVYEIGKRHAVKGFDKFEHSDTYLTTVWSPALVTKASARYAANDEIDDFFFEAVMSEVDARALANIDEAKARRIGRGLRTRLVELNRWTDLDRTLNLSGDKTDMIEEVLKDAGIDGETIKDVLYGLRQPGDEANTLSVAKSRTILNLNYSRRMSDGEILRVSDLIDNNAERLFERYAHQVVGAAATTQIYRQFGVESFDALKRVIARDMEASGAARAEIDRALDLLEIADKHVRGIPLIADTSGARFTRRMMGFNYLTMSGGFGLAQVAEFGGAVASAGFVAMAQQVPEFGKILKRARSGEWDSELANGVEVLTGLGTEGMVNSFARRFQDEIDPTTWRQSKFDFALHQANRFASQVSMLLPIDSFTRRATGILAAQKFVNIAAGRPISKRRLASLGLSEAEGERLTKAIRAEREAQRGIRTETGIVGQKVTHIDIDAWRDQGAASLFVSAFDRWSRTAIQTNSLGAMHPWLATSPLAKALFQFRGFMLQAWEKQFLHRVQVRDWEAFSSAMTTMFVGGLVYAAQQHALSVGREDREKFLEERLSDKAIAAAAFQRSGWSSLLPTGIDTALRLGQRDTIFNYGNSGLNRALSLDANPTSYNLNQAFRGIGGAIGAATQRDEEFGEQDARALMLLLPFRNVMGVRNVIEAVAQRFPEE